MRTVHKYELTAVENKVSTHRGVRWLHVANQDERPVIWGEVDTDELPDERTLWLIGTGQEVPVWLTYLGSALLADGEFVFHVYEQPQPLTAKDFA